jgi:hypothetical protein
MMFAVEADKDSHELTIRKDETALAVLLVAEHTYWLDRDVERHNPSPCMLGQMLKVPGTAGRNDHP